MIGEPADTPTAILVCAAELLRQYSFDDISYRALGAAVGVSERTVYRQYPTRSHLLEALAEWIEAREFVMEPFVTLPQFHAAVRKRFRDYDSSPAFAFVCARAATVSPISQTEPTFLVRAIEAMVLTRSPTLNDRDLHRIVATLTAFSSAPFWSRMRTAFDMDADEIAAVFERTSSLVVGAATAGRAQVAR